MFPVVATKEGVDSDSADRGFSCVSSRLQKDASSCQETSLSSSVTSPSGKKASFGVLC